MIKAKTQGRAVIETDTVRRMYADHSAADIAALLNVKPKRVYQIAGKLGLKKTSAQLSAIHKEIPVPDACKAGWFVPRHGKAGGKSAAYKVWKGMRQRCTYSGHKSFPRYGGRGIKVCAAWDLFEAFYADMGEPMPGMTIGRIDNDGNYEPTNCRWESMKQQARNRSGNRMLKAFGSSKCAAAWAEEFGIRRDTLMFRVKRWGSVEAALVTPLGRTIRPTKWTA